MDQVPNDQSPIVVKEALLNQDKLEHALAFKDKSAQLLSDSVAKVQSLSQGGQDLYAPYFPSWRKLDEPQSVRLTPNSPNEGRLAPAEAAALQVLASEHAALYQALSNNAEIPKETAEVLKIDSHMWPSIIDGIRDFANKLKLVTAVRERILQGLGQPTGSTSDEKFQQLIWERFQGAIKADQMTLGEHTAQAIVDSILNEDEKIIINDSQGETEAEAEVRINSLKHGATLAKALYVEAREKAGRQLPSTLPAYITEIRNDPNQPKTTS